MTNLDAKGAKRSVQTWASNFYKSFSKVFCCTWTVGCQIFVQYIRMELSRFMFFRVSVCVFFCYSCHCMPPKSSTSWVVFTNVCKLASLQKAMKISWGLYCVGVFWSCSCWQLLLVGVRLWVKKFDIWSYFEPPTDWIKINHGLGYSIKRIIDSLVEVCSPHLYASFGTFCVQIS